VSPERGRAAAWAVTGLLAALGAGCRGAPKASAEVPDSATPQSPSPSGARFVAIDGGSWISRSEDGTDMLVVDGSRMATKGRDVLRVGGRHPFIDDGIAVPAWARSPGGAFRYVFWNRRDVYGAADFTGELKHIATLPERLHSAKPWFDGVALWAGGGLSVVTERGVVRRPSIRGAAMGLAVDQNRAVVQTLLGSTRLTTDGGKTFQDVTATLGEVTSFARVGDDLELRVAGGRRRYLVPSGQVSEVRGSTGPRQDRRPPLEVREWPSQEEDPYLLSVSSGVQLSASTVLIVGRDHVAKLDLSSGAVSDVVEMPDDRGDCDPIQLFGEPLLLCVTSELANVYTLRGELSLERSFPLTRSVEQSWLDEKDRFAGVPGQALGFLGPCAGEPPRELLDVTSGASSVLRGRHDRRFCVRASRGQWVEHEVSAEDADAVVAWIPRRHGSAAALIGQRGTFLGSEIAVETMRGLLVVRVAREAPPLEMDARSVQQPQLLSTRLRVAPDGAIVGWLPSTSDVGGWSSVRIDRTGRVVQPPVPLDVTRVEMVGRFALGESEHGEVFESVDWGQSWHLVRPPPGHWGPTSLGCTTVGCRFQGVARIGWDGQQTAEPKPRRRPHPKGRHDRPTEQPVPMVRLACEFVGAPDEKRLAKSFGFGVTSQAVSRRRRGPRPVGNVGWVWVPNTNASGMPLSGKVEAAWMRPLDVTGRIHRSTLSLDGEQIERSSFWLRVGYALRKDGGIDPFAISSSQECAAPLSVRLGMLSPMGGCHPDPSVGVEVDGRVLIVSGSSSELEVTAVQPDDAPTGGSSERSTLLRRRWTYVPDRRLAVGRRGRDAFVASFDAYGDAVAARMDLERGRLEEERPLAAVSRLALANHPSCRGSDPDEALFLVNLKHEVGLSPSLFGLTTMGEGFAVIRWSEARACLEALELSVRDQHLEANLGRWGGAGKTSKLVARFGGGRPEASLIFVDSGAELRQPLSCSGVAP